MGIWESMKLKIDMVKIAVAEAPFLGRSSRDLISFSEQFFPVCFCNLLNHCF